MTSITSTTNTYSADSSTWTYSLQAPDSTGYGLIFYGGYFTGTYGTQDVVDFLNAGLVGTNSQNSATINTTTTTTPTATTPVVTPPALPAPVQAVVDTVSFVPWTGSDLSSVASSINYQPITTIAVTLITPSAYPYDVSDSASKTAFQTNPLSYMAKANGYRWTPLYY